MTNYWPTVDHQNILQEALKRCGRGPEAVAVAAGVPRAASSLKNFRSANLDHHWDQKHTLKLDSGVGHRVWNYLRPTVEEVLEVRGLRETYARQDIAHAMLGFLHTDAAETRSWFNKDGLQSTYFCYKPSFSRPGTIIKSRLDIKLVSNDIQGSEYFEVNERQESKLPGDETVERSTGFGLCKTRYLWLFLKETMYHQPRIFCMFMQHLGQEQHIERLFGYVLECDPRYMGAYRYKVGFSSIESDEALWKHLHPGARYDPEIQVDVIPHSAGAKASVTPNPQLCVDAQILRHIEDDVLQDTISLAEELRARDERLDGLNARVRELEQLVQELRSVSPAG